MRELKHASNLSDNPFKSLADLCDEAVARHGADWRGIERYVSDELEKLGKDERDQITAKIQNLLKFATTPGPSDSSH
jgi:hypothetical protein